VTLRPSSWGQPAGLLSAAAATTLLFRVTDLDLRVSAHFFHPADPGGQWPEADRTIWATLHRLTPWLALALAVTGLAMMVAGRLRAGGRPLAIQGLLVVLGLALGPGLVVNGLLKDYVRRPRPRETLTLGGDHQYVPLLAKGPHGKSFPCGDASVWFAVGVFGYVLHRRRRPAAAFIAVVATLLLGLAIGLARIAIGAHFLSDVLWAGLLVWGTLLALDRVLARVEAASDDSSGRAAITRPARRRLVWLAAGGGALAVVLLAALPFEQVVDRSWTPAPRAVHADAGAPWRIEVGVETGSARVIFTPGGHPADPDAVPDAGTVATGAVLSLHGRLRGFAAPWARVRVRIDERAERRLVRVSVRPRGWFADREGTIELRIVAAAAEEVDVEVPDGALTLVAAPGAGPLPVVITRTRKDALRLRGLRPDQVRIAGPRPDAVAP